MKRGGCRDFDEDDEDKDECFCCGRRTRVFSALLGYIFEKGLVVSESWGTSVFTHDFCVHAAPRCAHYCLRLPHVHALTFCESALVSRTSSTDSFLNTSGQFYPALQVRNSSHTRTSASLTQYTPQASQTASPAQ